MRSVYFALLSLTLLSGCSPTTPLFIAQLGGQDVVEYKTMKTNRMSAAVEEESDLLTYSAQAIRNNKSAGAEELYLTGYRDKNFSGQIRAISLYQIGLVYMSRYNDDRDDKKALNYLYQVTNEFPATLAAQRAQARIQIINQRSQEPIQKTARELLVHWQPSSELNLEKPSLDRDLTMLSRRAVLKDRVGEASQLYLLALGDSGVPEDIKAKALYQLALMNMASDNPQADRDAAIGYLRQLLSQYPDSDLYDQAARHLDNALNNPAP
ncbi:MAG: tetratricopeptide repeat protein [Pseudomonadaceae bacterium]|nr:tetratricopeptide repeat protein [Pseudomonadaceae bacterium]